jgi:hypothetical protein
MYQKQKELAMIGENLDKSYIIETTTVSKFMVAGWPKTRGEKIQDSPIMLLKTHVGKMPVFGLAKILLKSNDL